MMDLGTTAQPETGFEDEDQDDEASPLTAGALGRALQNAMPGLVEDAGEGEVVQRDDEELMVWGGYGFRIHLSDGTAMDVQIHQR